MNTNQKTAEIVDRKVILSTLWIFAMFNYLYADVYGLFFNPVLQKELTKELLSGYIGSIQITQGFVLVTAILMETAIAMVLLSRILKYSANRWVNIIAGLFHTAFVAWSLIGETPTLFYAFFATIEIACTLFIAWYAWRWRTPEGEGLSIARKDLNSPL
jgi:Ni,Fe-hydrogenase I cytochrome b subunit